MTQSARFVQMLAHDTTLLTLPEGFDPELDSPAMRVYAEANTHVVFSYLPGGYLVYQCLATDPRFQSDTYKLHEFRSPQGLQGSARIISKNSPIVIDAFTLALHGAYREFDFKPSILYVGTWEKFTEVTNRFIAALMHLDVALGEPDFQPRVIEARDADGFD